ncbi:hypothetical protein WH35_04120, partial [Wolbachia endosymbiont of Drosophila incompta]
MLKEVDFQHAIKALYADRACDSKNTFG